MPVCDDRGRLVGMLSEGDLLRRAELRSVSWRDIAGVRTKPEAFIKGHSWRVGDVMTQPVVTVMKTCPLAASPNLWLPKVSSTFRSCERKRW
ncbi:CBS domain-containing protein [Sinorhizobium meliloti]|uniref:CBS domain-containing protein n=1 Tax=Rhizobium meliloti TaxID=382 RepID=UPI001F172E70|nr:CBS domain-containing protein [Sinorhizobium meliloti]